MYCKLVSWRRLKGGRRVLPCLNECLLCCEKVSMHKQWNNNYSKRLYKHTDRSNIVCPCWSLVSQNCPDHRASIFPIWTLDTIKPHNCFRWSGADIFAAKILHRLSLISVSGCVRVPYLHTRFGYAMCGIAFSRTPVFGQKKLSHVRYLLCSDRLVSIADNVLFKLCREVPSGNQGAHCHSMGWG